MRQPLCEIPRLNRPEALSTWQIASEAALVGGAALAAVLITRSGVVPAFLSPEDASAALAVLAGALALATAAMWHVVRWLSSDGRASLAAGAMALYALVAIPTNSLGTVLSAGAAIDAGRLATHLVVVMLLLGSSMESMAQWRPGSQKLLAAGLLVVSGAITFGFLDPARALAVTQVPTLRWLVVAGWVLAGVRVTRIAVRRGLEPSVWVGFGLTLLAMAHCYRLATELGDPGGLADLTFAAVRLVALSFIGLGALQFSKRALQILREEVQPQPLEAAQGGEAFEIGPGVRYIATRYADAGLDIQWHVAPGLAARGSSDLLDEVLAQLLTNCALHAPGSPIKIMAWKAGDRVVLRVSDLGPGIPEHLQQTIFGRDTGGSESSGRQRGLSTCRTLLGTVGGAIRVYGGAPKQGSGCTIQVELPSAEVSGVHCGPLSYEARFSTFANEQAQRAARVFDDATQAARRVAAFASQQPTAGRLEGLPRLGIALALLVATVAVSRIPVVLNWLVTREVGVSLALVAVAGGVLSAFACAVLGQLGDEPAGLWLSAGLAFYSVVGIPVATYNANSPDSEAAISNLRFVANAIFVALMLAAVSAQTRPRQDGWVVLFCGLMLDLGAAALGLAYPAESLALSTNPAMRLGLSACWLLSGVALIAAGRARRTAWLSWSGIGCTIIAIAHAQRVVAGSPFIPLGSTFTSVRLLGVLVLTAGVVPAARRVLVEAYTARHRHLAELREAQTGLQRFAERDHDLRGGLAALVNANVLLESRVRSEEEQGMLRAAVNAELQRLNQMLRPPDFDDREDSAYDYEIADVLEERIMLQTTPDMDVRVDIEPNLCVHGNPLVLSQVLANVLANWQRHAPGSPLRIQAMRHDETVVLRVCDFGPGIPADLENRIFDLSVRGPASTGQGFGLHICRRLLEDESGRIYIQQRRGGGTGCTVVIELPAADSDGTVSELPARMIS